MRNLSILLVCLLLISNNALSQSSAIPKANVLYFKQVSDQAGKGNASAEACLGELYAGGFGTTRDFHKALKWYKSAAHIGNLNGKEQVGKVYQWGIGVKPDPAKAMTIFRELIHRGYMPAATDIGLAYDTGVGVPKDKSVAISWYRKAAFAGDYWGEVRLGLHYAHGEGVRKNSTEAKLWLERAADHEIDCFPEFEDSVPFIINGYMKSKLDQADMDTSIIKAPGIIFVYRNRKAEKVKLMGSSGWPELDNAWLSATRKALLPPWPSSFHSDNKILGFWITAPPDKPHPGFIQPIRHAIQSAVVVPKQVLLHGSQGTGLTTVSFFYMDGKVTDIKITKSSGDKNEDAAAILAVKNAAYPPTPKSYIGRRLHTSITVSFGRYTPAPTETSMRTHTSG